MADLTYSIDIDDRGAQSSLTTLEKKVTDLNKRIGTLQNQINKLKTTPVTKLTDSFNKLGAALAGIGIGAFIAKSIQAADAVQDISDATGIATATILGLGASFQDAAGSAQGAQQSILKFAESIDEAVSGGGAMQIAFQKAGITLDDLRTLSEEELLKKTIDGVSQLSDATERLSLQTQLMGKGAKGVDFTSVNASLAANIALNARNASATEAAAAAQGRMEVTMRNLSSAVLTVIEPLNQFISKINITQEDFEQLIKIVGLAGGVFLIFTKGLGAVTSTMNTIMGSLRSGGGMLTWFLAQMKSIGNNGALIFKNLGLAGINAAKSVGAVGPASGTTAGVLGSLAAAAANVMRIFLKFAGITGVIITLAEAVDFLLKKFFNVTIVSDFFRIVAIGLEEISIGFGKLLNLPTDIIGKILGIDSAKGLGTPFVKLGEMAKQARKDAEDLVEQQKYNTAEEAKLNAYAQKAKEQAEAKEKINRAIVDATRQEKLELDKVVNAYRLANEESLRQMAFQNTLIGLDEDRARTAQRFFDLETGYLQQVQQLQTKFNELKAAAAVGTDEEKAKFQAFAQVYSSGLDRIKKQYEDQKTILEAIDNSQLILEANEKNRLDTLEQITKQYDFQQQAATDLSRIQQETLQKVRDLEFERTQMGLSAYEKEKNLILRNNQLAMQGEMDAIAAKQEFAEGEDGLDPSRAKAFADQIGAIQDRYKSLNEEQLKNLETSRSWEAGWNEAFNNYYDDANNAAKQAGAAFKTITERMNDAIDNFVKTGKFSFKDLTKSIIQDIIAAELKLAASKLFSSITSTAGSFLSSLFGYANGGNPPVGKPSIVGERGPELFVPKTAGTIIPNNKLGMAAEATGTGMVNAPVTNNYITNNINALDAKSVAQLFAENRKTLLGATEMARKEMPYGGR